MRVGNLLLFLLHYYVPDSRTLSCGGGRLQEVTSMRTPLFIPAAGLLVLVAGAPLAAHHSFAAEFDGSKPVTLKGTVTKMEWTNPHAWLHVDVKGPKGEVVSWMIEGGAPNALLRRGWNKNSIAPGTAVMIQGFQARDGSHRASGGDLTLPDGKKLFIGSTGTGAPGDDRGAAGKK
jgi:hypothetical protein